MDIQEHFGIAPLIEFIEKCNDESDKAESWMVANLRKDCMRPITNEAFLMTLQSVMERASSVHVFFVDQQKLYVVWQGEAENVYRKLRSFVISELLKKERLDTKNVVISYVDLHISGPSFLKQLRDEQAQKYDSASKKRSSKDDEKDPFGWNEDKDDPFTPQHLDLSSLHMPPDQISFFRKAKSEKRDRKKLHVLIAEDDLFYQKLICEVIRGYRQVGVDAPLITVADSVTEAWENFSHNAPDLVFVDLGLKDGSGHTLTRAIKELDPESMVVIVSGNQMEEETSVARQNNADAFITKPYNKQQIFSCLEKAATRIKKR